MSEKLDYSFHLEKAGEFEKQIAQLRAQIEGMKQTVQDLLNRPEIDDVTSGVIVKFQAEIANLEAELQKTIEYKNNLISSHNKNLAALNQFNSKKKQ